MPAISESSLILSEGRLHAHKGGLTLIKEVRDRRPDQPVIAISGGGKDGKPNFHGNANPFRGVKALGKPFGHQDLLGLVAEVLP